jgi:zinc transport system substrate-binding protein
MISAKHLAAVFFISLLLLFSCERERSSHRPRVVAGIMPQKYLLERLGGEYLDISVLVQPGESPHTFIITPRQADSLISAGAFFVSGLEFEDILLTKLRSQLQGVLIVNTARDIPLRTFRRPGGEQAVNVGTHDHGITDPHTWLNPLFFITQARAMRDALCELDPQHASAYKQNFKILADELRDLDKRIRVLLEPVRGRVLLVFHPAFGYFADAYGLVQEAVEAEGKAAGSWDMEKTIEFIKNNNIRVLFTQPQDPGSHVSALADALKLQVVVLDPLVFDYEKNLLAMADKIKQALEQGR